MNGEKAGIAGKVVVITGASSGLARLPHGCFQSWVRRQCWGRRRVERLQALADELTANGGQVLARATDVTKAEQVRGLVDAGVETYGRVDVLLNNAGVMPQAPLERLRIDEWDQTIDVNIKGVLYGIAAALPHMQRQKSGHIINVSSVVGDRVGPGGVVYSATKTAVCVISEGLRQEVKPYN